MAANDDSGISTAKADSASQFLTGPQVGSVVGAMGAVGKAAGGVTAAAAKRPGQIRQASREANALLRAQVARQSSIAKQGIATGGGVGRAGGSTALDLMRQASASAVAAEDAAGLAEVQAKEKAVEEATVLKDTALSEAEIVAAQQAQIGSFVTNLATEISGFKTAGQGNDEIGGLVGAKLGSLELGFNADGTPKDPSQMKAAVGALQHWAGFNGASSIGTEHQVQNMIKLLGPQAATWLGEDASWWGMTWGLMANIEGFLEGAPGQTPPEGWAAYLEPITPGYAHLMMLYGVDLLPKMAELWAPAAAPTATV